MTFVKVLNLRESQTQVRDQHDSLLRIVVDRDAPATGGFIDNWDRESTEPTAIQHQSPTPVKIWSYRVRLYTTEPTILYSSQVDNYWLAKQAPAGVNTDFSQLSMANGLLKKWTYCVDGGYWSKLDHRFAYLKKGKNGRKKMIGTPLTLNDAIWKIQTVNKSPTSATNKYYGTVEFEMSYDAVSSV